MNYEMGLAGLPEDVLLEILGYLPALAVLSCRKVCRRLNRITQSRHLWIGIFHKTQHILPPKIDLNEIEGLELEKLVGRAEIMGEKWSDENALWMPPRYQRTWTLRQRWGDTPLCIVGDYIVFRSTIISDLRGYYNWISLSDLDGPIAFTYVVPPIIQCGHYAEAGGTTFSVSSLHQKWLPNGNLSLAIQVAQIEADPIFGPHVVADYTVPTRTIIRPVRIAPVYLETQNGLACIIYKKGGWIEIDVLDLESRVMKYLRISYRPPPVPPMTKASYTCLITKNRIIQIHDGILLAIFNDPPERCAHALNSPPQLVHLPVSLCWICVIPRSATSFAVVGISQVGGPESDEPPTATIYLLTVNLEETSEPIREIHTLDIPGDVTGFLLPDPPVLAQYALGVVSVKGCATQSSNSDNTMTSEDFTTRYYAIKLELSQLAYGNSCSGSQGERGCISLSRMFLTPAINEKEEVAVFQCFDPFSGKIVAGLFPRVDPNKPLLELNIQTIPVYTDQC